LENPFGRSYMLVAESEGRIVGFRAVMRWRFSVGGRTFDAVRPVDTATHPDHRGQGVFSRLTRTALDDLRGQVDLVFNTPNPDSLAGYLKMGWHVVGSHRPSVRVCRAAVRLARGVTSADRLTISAPTAAEALADESEIGRLIDAAEVPTVRLSTPITADFLRWRYGEAPLLDYHAVREERGGELTGLGLFRPRREGRRWGVVVSQLLVRAGDVGTARALLAQARRSADVAFVATLFPRDSTGANASRGLLWIRAPRSITFVVNPLRPGLVPDPLLLSSWALSTGDLEVF
jgi:plasmid stabilization system protein ParE